MKSLEELIQEMRGSLKYFWEGENAEGHHFRAQVETPINCNWESTLLREAREFVDKKGEELLDSVGSMGLIVP